MPRKNDEQNPASNQNDSSQGENPGAEQEQGLSQDQNPGENSSQNENPEMPAPPAEINQATSPQANVLSLENLLLTVALTPIERALLMPHKAEKHSTQDWLSKLEQIKTKEVE
jgi:hypothetical protein